MTALFDEFSAVTKAEWHAKILQDLRGQNIEDLTWEIDDGIELDPFTHESDCPISFNLSSFKLPGAWQIGERVDFMDHHQLLSSLRTGINAPEFRINKTLYLSDFQTNFSEVQIEIIDLHFLFSILEKAIVSLQEWDQYIELHGANRTLITGSFVTNVSESWSPWIQTVKEYYQQFPGFRFFHIEISEGTSLVQSLVKGLNQLYDLYRQCEKEGLDLALIPQLTKIKVFSSMSTVKTICFLRAIRWLAALLHEYITNNRSIPFIDVCISNFTDQKHAYHNLIRSTMLGLAAIAGGADRLSFNLESQNNSEFYPRITRNIHHLLQLESNLHSIPDPAAGSLILDSLTEQLAEKAWNHWQEH